MTSATTAIAGSSDDRLEVGREHAVARGKILTLAIEVAHERAHDPQPMAGRALDVVGALARAAG